MKRCFLFLSLLFIASAQADTPHYTLQSALSLRLKEVGYLPKLESERTWAASNYNPIQSFEYRYGRSDEDNKRYYRVPWHDQGGEQHTIRIHIKSLEEIISSNASRDLSQQLLNAEKREIINQRNFDVYLDVVEQALQTRVHKLLAGREGELQKTWKTSGQLMGLAKANVKDLVRELERIKQVDADLEGSKAQQELAGELSEKEAEEAARALIENVGALAKRIGEVQWSSEQLQIARKRIETKLSRIDRQIGWAQDRKIIDHIDIQRDTLEREDSVRIAFNIPFLRFDNENRARDKALLLAKESSLNREAAELRSSLRRQKAEVFSLAAQVESLKNRLQRTRGISDKIKGIQDIELRAVLGDFNFELERDVLLLSLKFYTAYLEFLRDQGAFASYNGQNMLKPNWPRITL